MREARSSLRSPVSSQNISEITDDSGLVIDNFLLLGTGD